jgi:putative spermidine/putrescine transport system permease protein
MVARAGNDARSLNAVLATIGVATLVLLMAPSLVVIVVSFTSGFSLKFPPPGYSLRWYVALTNAWQLQFAAKNSLAVALATTALTLAAGVPAALAIARSQRAAARVLDTIFMSPLVLPALAFGLAALMWFSLLGLAVSPLTLVIGHAVVCVPFVIRTTVAALAELDPNWLECSASLGASAWHTFRRVTLPTIRPGVLAGGFFAFISSFDNVPVSLFLRDARTDMLPIRMWQDLEGKLDVTAAALSTVLIATTLIALVVMERVAGLSRRMT